MQGRCFSLPFIDEKLRFTASWGYSEWRERSFLTPGLAGSLLYFAVLSLKCKQIPNSFGFCFKTTPCEGPKVIIFTGVKSLM